MEQAKQAARYDVLLHPVEIDPETERIYFKGFDAGFESGYKAALELTDIDTLRVTDINHPHLRILHDSQLLNSDVWSVIRGGFHPDKPQIGEWCLLTYFQTDYGQNSYLTPGILGNSFIQPVMPSMSTRIVKIVTDDPLKIVEYSLEDGQPIENDKTQDYGNPENIAWSRLPEIRPLTKSDMAWHQRDNVSGYYIPIRAKLDRTEANPLLTRTVAIGLSDTVLKRIESL